MVEARADRGWSLVELRAEAWQQTRDHAVSLSSVCHWFSGQDLNRLIQVTQGAF